MARVRQARARDDVEVIAGPGIKPSSLASSSHLGFLILPIPVHTNRNRHHGLRRLAIPRPAPPARHSRLAVEQCGYCHGYHVLFYPKGTAWAAYNLPGSHRMFPPNPMSLVPACMLTWPVHHFRRLLPPGFPLALYAHQTVAVCLFDRCHFLIPVRPHPPSYISYILYYSSSNSNATLTAGWRPSSSRPKTITGTRVISMLPRAWDVHGRRLTRRLFSCPCTFFHSMPLLLKDTDWWHIASSPSSACSSKSSPSGRTERRPIHGRKTMVLLLLRLRLRPRIPLVSGRVAQRPAWP